MTQDEDRYVPLVVRLQTGADSVWRLHIYTEDRVRVMPLHPCTLVVRMRRFQKSGILRGRVQIEEQGEWVPFQCTSALETLVRSWLFDES